MELKSRKSLSKRGALAAAILWSVATALGLIKLVLDLGWSKETTLSFLVPFLSVVVTMLLLINAIRYWRLFTNYKENNE